jgi:hypothetical protein
MKVSEFHDHFSSIVDLITHKKTEIFQIGHLMFKLSALLYFSRQMTLKLALKVNELRGCLFLKGSAYEGAQIEKLHPNRTICLRVSSIVFSQGDALKTDCKGQQISSSIFLEGSPDVVKQNKTKVHPNWTFVFELFAFLTL